VRERFDNAEWFLEPEGDRKQRQPVPLGEVEKILPSTA
jgi:hypothetical protein